MMAFNEVNVPKGFRNLLEGLTLEVLRVKPTNIPKFAAEYFRKRLTLRQEKGFDECLLGSQIDGFYQYEPNRPEHTNKLLDSTVQDSLNNAYDTSFQPHATSQKGFISEDHAASKIQAGFHGYKVRQKIKTQDQAAEKIQAGYRGYACRKDIKNQNEAASRIQAEFRGYQVRKETKIEETSGERDKENKTRQAKFKVENDAATKIQAEFRGYQARKGVLGKQGAETNDSREPGKSTEEMSVSHARESHERKEPQEMTGEDKAATRIQAGYRGFRERKGIARRMEASTKIQASYRGYRGRKELTKKKDASVKIQATYRGYHARKNLKTKHKASTTIQSGYRGYRVRKVKNSQSEAAVKIQAQYRGYRVRKGLKTAGRQSFAKNSLAITHLDSRFSFSLPQEDVKFEGNLDSDSDTDIDQVVKKIEAKKNEMKEEKNDDVKGDENQV